MEIELPLKKVFDKKNGRSKVIASED